MSVFKCYFEPLGGGFYRLFLRGNNRGDCLDRNGSAFRRTQPESYWKTCLFLHHQKYVKHPEISDRSAQIFFSQRIRFGEKERRSLQWQMVRQRRGKITN